MKYIQNKAGFTLLEIMLYVSLAAFLLFTLSLFLGLVMEGRVKQHTIAEVEGAGQQIIAVISQTVRNADAILSPAIGSSGIVMSLDTYAAPTDPTVFDLQDGSLRTQEGSEVPVTLHGNRVSVSNFTISNLSRQNTPGTIRYQFTVSYLGNGRQEYTYSKTFYGSASIR